ncbi:MAG: OsmC family protein [Armatimonadota bacterium]|nr:OsmC family protein [Armatimonadota bacterium]MDR7550413.1 OsmC family protein [Armatimonadota bacterium]
MQATVRLTQEEGYRFAVEMERPRWALTVDEAPPIGRGQGPNPARMLAVAVGHCLSSSLLCCLQKSRVEGARINTEVTVAIRRNDRGRWRVAGLNVVIDVSGVDPARQGAVERCRQLFEDFCIVTESVRHGVPVDVAVRAGEAG